MYGRTGICKVQGITTLDSPNVDHTLSYYVLEPLYQDGMIYTPINKIQAPIRPVISREEAEKLIDMIPLIRAEAYHNRNLSELTRHYESILNTNNCADLIELTLSIYAKKKYCEEEKRKFGVVDSKYMKRAEDLLFGELAHALDISKEDIPAYIAARVS
jgi:CarD family transcriptional regulator